MTPHERNEVLEEAARCVESLGEPHYFQFAARMVRELKMGEAKESHICTIDIFLHDGCDPFICAVSARAPIDTLQGIENQFVSTETRDNLSSGDGVYRFSFRWVEPQFGDEGRMELSGYYDFNLIKFTPMDVYLSQSEEECKS